MTFPKLLGMLGTDIAENFADRIFEAFSSNKININLCEYLKYIDIYHYGDEHERCRVTLKLMDYSGDGKITLQDFQKYISLIMMAVKKVNPGVMPDLLSITDVQNLFYKISDGKDVFTYDDFKKVYDEKPELVSWIDYFKNSNNDILLIINDNIRLLIGTIREFLKNFAVNLTDVLITDKKSIDFSLLTEKINEFNKDINKKQKKFLKSIDQFNIRTIFNKLLNNPNENKKYEPIEVIKSQKKSNIFTNKVSDKLIEMPLEKEINIDSNGINLNVSNDYIIDTTAKLKDDTFTNIHANLMSNKVDKKKLKKINTFFSNVKQAINKEDTLSIEEKKSEPQTKKKIELEENEENVPSEESEEPIKECLAKVVKAGNITRENEKIKTTSSNMPSNSNNISNNNTVRTNTNILSSNSLLIDTDNINVTILNKQGGMNKLAPLKTKNYPIQIDEPIVEEEKNHIIMDSNEVKSFLKCLGTFVETSYNVMQNIEESYRWIKKNYLSPIIKKIKHSKQKKKNTESQFATQNIPKKMVKPKKQYLIRAPDNSFKILLNMIMGIQIAVQSTPNYDINPEKEDLTKYLNKMSYSIQTTNFGLKKQETFYLREYAGIIFNNIRHTFGYDKDAFIASISPQDFVTEIMISSQTIFEELCSTGKSGSLFYYTRDGKFIVKTIGKDEYKFLKKILPEYFKHIKSNPNTLITKFFGCYQLVKKVKKRKDKFYFIIMMNIFCTSRDIQLRYDLKGSKIGRRVLKQTKEDQKILEMDNYALKDLDLDRIKQKAKIGNKKEPLMEQLRRDAEFLCRISAIDYSLLLGIHKIPNKQDFEKKETILSAKTFRLEDIKIKNKRNSEIPSNPNQRFESHKDDSQSENKLKKVNTVSNNFINHFNTNNNSANNPPVISKDNSENTKLNIALSVSNESNQNELELKSPIFDYEDGGIASEDQNEIYYVGIIDILTEYNCKKSTEHFFKMIYYCSQKMSCVAPPLYRDRFINYMDSVIINSSSIVDKKENKNE